MVDTIMSVGFILFVVGVGWWIAAVKDRWVNVPMFHRLMSQSRYTDPKAQERLERDVIRKARQSSRVGMSLALLGVALMAAAYGLDAALR